MSDLELDGNDLELFKEPDDYRPPSPEPTYQAFHRESKNVKQGQPESLNVRMVGKHPLWGHMLWNASKVVSNYLDSYDDASWSEKTVLELGAGAALPSMIAAIRGSRKTVVTDYPDPDLLKNIDVNSQTLLPKEFEENRIVTKGHLWGAPVDDLLELISPATKYDIVILSDLIFNHSQHDALLRTTRSTLAPVTGRAYVFFTHHRPKLAHKDMEFFDRAQGKVHLEDAKHLPFNFHVRKIMEQRLQPMFSQDEGPAEVRATVHGYELWLDA